MRVNKMWNWILLAGLLSVPVAPAAGQSNQQQKADELFKAGEWAKAAQAYADLTKAEPENAQAWFQLGASLHEIAEFSRSAEAFEKAEKAGFRPAAQALFRQVRAYARAGDRDKAFAALARLAAAGFLNTQLLNSQADLESLRADARFAEALKEIDKNARPCAYRPEYRQLDFWIGEWDVFPTGGQGQAGSSSIQLILDRCIIFENWTGTNGYTGKSFNLFDSTTGKWEQIWVDSRGGIIKFEGQLKDGVLHYYADAPGPNGEPGQRHLQFIPQGPNQVRQFSQRTGDGGKTWQVEYDLTYKRKQ